MNECLFTTALLWDKKQERHPLLFGSPAHVAALIRMTFFAPTTPRERERAKQRSPAHVAATFQQRPHINTTDLILEMARKEKSERGRKAAGREGVRIRDNASPALLRGIPVVLLPQVSLLAAVL